MDQDKLNISQLSNEFYAYVERNADADGAQLMLRNDELSGAEKRFAALQIDCRRRCRNKLPHLIGNARFLFATQLNAEQCSHELVAQFHAECLHMASTVVDLTMGLGVDTLYMAHAGKKVIGIERDQDTYDVTKHNLTELGEDVQCVNTSAEEFLQLDFNTDAFFIDPARRSQSGGRVYGFDQCSPNILELLPTMAKRARWLLIKASPMLDVGECLRQLGPQVICVWAVAVDGECKELCFLLDFSYDRGSLHFTSVNFVHGQKTEFALRAEDCGKVLQASKQLPSTGEFLYVPNAAVSKFHCTGALQDHFGLEAIDHNINLLYSHQLHDQFPGRIFQVEQSLPYNGRVIKELVRKTGKMNIATRNFPISADDLRKKYKIPDGGNTYLFAIEYEHRKHLIICKKPTIELK